MIGWCFFFTAATAGLATQLSWSFTTTACSFGFCTGVLLFLLWRRQGEGWPNEILVAFYHPKWLCLTGTCLECSVNLVHVLLPTPCPFYPKVCHSLRQGEKTPLVKRRSRFLAEWPLALAHCDRGPDRSMTAGKLLDFLQLLVHLFTKNQWSWLDGSVK